MPRNRLQLFFVGFAFWPGVVMSPKTLTGQELEVLARHDIALGQVVREPAVVQLPDGRLFAAGFSRDPEEAQDPPNLYRSSDLGRTWVQVDVGTVEEGALGNSDVDLKLGPDGSLYFLSMGFDRAEGAGTHVALGISRDAGETWTWRFISRSRFDDRPWIGLTPAGRTHVIWNDGQGVRHAASSDKGDTWIEEDRISEGGGSSHLAVGPSGEIAVRITPRSASGRVVEPEYNHIAVSLDDGHTWVLHAAPGISDWGPFPARWVEPVAWDQAGSLYALWSAGTVLRLGVSRDYGATWEEHDVYHDTDVVLDPLLVSGPAGLLGASWFSRNSADRTSLRAHVGLIDTSSGGLEVRIAPPLEVDSWTQGGPESGVRDPSGEYFPVVFLQTGDLGAVLPMWNSPHGDGLSWLRIGR